MDIDASKDYYEALGVPKDASQDDIKKAFREVAKKYHPDRQSGKSEAEKMDAEARFKEANDAYEVLSDEGKRRQYDQLREMSSMGGFGRMGGFGHMGGFGRTRGFNPFGEDDEYTSVKPKPSVRPERGQVAKAVVSVSFEEMVYGAKDKAFSCDVLRECKECGGSGGGDGWEMCDRCGGTGWLKTVRGIMTQISNCPHCRSLGWIRKGNCANCGGTGVVAERHEFTVSVPKGSVEGTLLRLAGVGHAGAFGGPRNDLIVMVHVLGSDRFEIGDDGLSLYTLHTISPLTAMLGNEKEEVTTPWGVCEVKIPKGCQEGTKLRLKGQGVPNLRDGGQTRGDLYAIVHIDIPSEFSGKELKKVEDFRKWWESSSLNKAVEAERKAGREYAEMVKERFGSKE